jgi:hypothetical protein
MPLIEKGVWPSCSESVFRFPKKHESEIPSDVLNAEWMEGCKEPTKGYSQMRPTDGTTCLYFYQTSGDTFRLWLEDNKIPYDAQLPFINDEHLYEPLERSAEENTQLTDGGNGDFVRRKPYGN